MPLVGSSAYNIYTWFVYFCVPLLSLSFSSIHLTLKNGSEIGKKHSNVNCKTYNPQWSYSYIEPSIRWAIDKLFKIRSSIETVASVLFYAGEEMHERLMSSYSQWIRGWKKKNICVSFFFSFVMMVLNHKLT